MREGAERRFREEVVSPRIEILNSRDQVEAGTESSAVIARRSEAESGD